MGNSNSRGGGRGGDADNNDGPASLTRTSSKLYSLLAADAAASGVSREELELQVRVAEVDDDTAGLTRTPSAQRDIEAATAAGMRTSFILKQAGRAQRLRAQLVRDFTRISR